MGGPGFNPGPSPSAGSWPYDDARESRPVTLSAPHGVLNPYWANAPRARATTVTAPRVAARMPPGTAMSGRGGELVARSPSAAPPRTRPPRAPGADRVGATTGR